MITFKAIVIPGNRRRDGTYPVSIRVTYKGVSRRLATTLVCTPSDLTRTLRIKNPTILSRADALIARMRDAVRDLSPFTLEDEDVDWVVRHIRDTLSGEDFRLDFFQWAEVFLRDRGEGSRRLHATALNALERYLGRREIDINSITRSMLLEMKEMIDGEPKMYWDKRAGMNKPSDKPRTGRGASSLILSRLEHIYNAAKDRYNDEDSGRIVIPRSPFGRIARERPLPHGQRNLGRELMQRIISYDTDNEGMRMALDAFIVSFGLMGANMADLYGAKPPKGGTWVYNRAKTASRRADGAEMRVDIPAELECFLVRLQGVRGGYWLNALHCFAPDKDQVTRKVNSHLARWCEENDVERFTFYAARHAWASLARAEGVDKSTLDDCLGHVGSFQIADIYAEKAWHLCQQANRRVLDLFEWR